MHRAVWISVIALLAACSTPGRDFDAGHDVHVILVADPRPKRPLAVRATCRLGKLNARVDGLVLGGAEPRAKEIALLRAPAGKYEFSFREASRGVSAALANVEVGHELWIVLIMKPKRTKAEAAVFDHPPHDEIGQWQPRVTLPN